MQYFKNIFNALKENTELKESNNMLLKEVTKLINSNKFLSEQLLQKEPEITSPIEKILIPVAGFDSTFDEPQEPMARKKYIEDVDYFADAVLNNKLKCAIADIREMLSNVVVVQGLPYNMQRSEYDWYLRGMHDHAWKMYEWMITCQGERRSRLQDKENKQ